MPNIPCPIPPLPCDDIENPLANLSAENPDLRRFFKRSFHPDYVQVCESTVSQELVDLCNPPPPGSTVIYQSGAVSQDYTCPNGTVLSYAIASGAIMAFTQAGADEQARALALSVLAQLCGNVPPGTPNDTCTIECANGTSITVNTGPDAAGSATACEIAELLCGVQELFPSTEQSCTVPCVNGGASIFTFPAGSFYGLTQAESDSNAYTFACLVASVACATPPVPTGTDPDSSPIWFTNKAVYCAVSCGTGSTFYGFAPAGLFFRRLVSQANAAAASYACSQATTAKVCLSSIPQFACAGSLYAQLITTAPTTEVTWSVIGSLPPGLAFESGLIMGTPTTTGSYAFAIRGTLPSGSYTQRTYSMLVAEITTALLPNATEDSAYSEQLTQSGFDAPLAWTIEDGSLPSGITLSNGGLLAGTPTESGVFDFTVRVTDANGFYCEKLYALEVEASAAFNPLEWWTMSEPGTGTPRVGSYNGVSLINDGDNAVDSVGGVIGAATRYLWTDSPDTYAQNTTAFTPLMPYTGNGLSISFWARFGSPNVGSFFVNHFFQNGASFEGLFRVWLDGFNSMIRVTLSAGGASASINQAHTPSGTFQFIQIILDPVTAKIYLRVNNGALIDTNSNITGVVANFPDAITLIRAIRQEGIAGSGTYSICDLSVYPFVLSSTQSDYLYGPAGAGRTWPAVLPP